MKIPYTIAEAAFRSRQEYKWHVAVEQAAVSALMGTELHILSPSAEDAIAFKEAVDKRLEELRQLAN